MKIALVHLNLAVESGDPRMFYHIAQGVKRKGHDTTVYTARFNPACFPKLHEGLRIVVCDTPAEGERVERGKGLFGAVRGRMMRNRFQDEGVARITKVLPHDVDILVCQNDRSYRLGAFYKKVNPASRVVWIMNNAPFYSERKSNILMTLGSRAVALLEKWRLTRSIRAIDLIVVHDEGRRLLAASLGKPTLLLHIPVDFPAFYHPVRQRTNGDKRVMLLGIGSLSPTRKFEDIIRAGALLRDRGYDVRVTLVCRDARGDVGYRQELLRLAHETRMEERITFRFDGASEGELHALQREADFFIFPNHITIWSMASFESMAAGAPLLVSQVTSVAEALKDGTEAMFFEPGNAKEIASCAEDLLKDPRRYKQVAEAGQKFVKEKLSWDVYIERFLGAASKVCNGSQTTS